MSGIIVEVPNLFRNGDFVDPTDPYKLALVDAGLRSGHFCIGMDKEEQEEIGGYEMQGKEAFQQKLEDTGLPFEAITSSFGTAPGYEDAELTVYYFAVANDQEHLDEFVSRFRDNPQNGETIGSFEGYPECCIDDYHPERDYMEELDNYLSENTVSEEEAQLLTVLPELSHIPCSFDCQESLAIASDYMEFFEKHYSETTIYYEEIINDRLD